MKEKRQGVPKYSEIFIQNFSVSAYVLQTFSRDTRKSTNFRAKTHTGVPAIFFFSTLISRVIC